MIVSGGGHIAEVATPPPTAESIELRHHLWSRLTSDDYHPPMLPTTAAQILSISNRDDVDLGDILRLLERDAMLAARVLKVAQSPFYARSMGIRSLRQAVVSLGLTAVRNMVAESVLHAKLFRVNGYTREMQALMEHCRATAYVSQLVCRHAGIDPDYAFMCGLFHDIGIPTTLQVLEEREAALGRRTPADAVWAAVNSMHCDAAALLVRQWKLPGGIEQVVKHHHDLACEPSARPLTTAIRLADCLAREIKSGKPVAQAADPVDESVPPMQQAVDVLAFSEKDIGSIREQSTSVLRQLSAA